MWSVVRVHSKHCFIYFHAHLELVNHESEHPRIWYYLKCDEETLCAFMVQKDLTSSDMELFALQKTQNTLHE